MGFAYSYNDAQEKVTELECIADAQDSLRELAEEGYPLVQQAEMRDQWLKYCGAEATEVPLPSQL